METNKKRVNWLIILAYFDKVLFERLLFLVIFVGPGCFPIVN